MCLLRVPSHPQHSKYERQKILLAPFWLRHVFRTGRHIEVMRVAICAVLLAGLVAAGTTPALGTTMEAVLDPRTDSSPFQMYDHITMFVEYSRTSGLSEFLDGKYWKLEVRAGPDDSGVRQLTASLNDKIRSDGSQSSVDSLVIEYAAWLTGGDSNTSIDFKITLTGNMTGYTIDAGQDGTLIDLNWMRLGSDESIVIDGIDINIPLNVLRDSEPVLYALIQDARYWDYHQMRFDRQQSYDVVLSTEESDISSMRLIDSDAILDLPMADWHYLFDPTLSVRQDGTLRPFSSNDMFYYPPMFDRPPDWTGFSMWTSGLVDFGTLLWHSAVTGGTNPAIPGEIRYNLTAVRSADRATIGIIGNATLDELKGAEVVVVTSDAATKSTQKDSVAVIYVAIALAAAGGLFVLFRSRARKRDRQTPSRAPA